MFNRASPGLRPLPPQLAVQTFHPPARPPPDPFWERPQLQAHLENLLQNVAILKSIGDELEAIQHLDGQSSSSGPKPRASDSSIDGDRDGVDLSGSSPSKEPALELVKRSVGDGAESVSLATQAAQQLMTVLNAQLGPLIEVLNGNAGAEKILAAKKLASQRKKLIRNRKWRSRKRRDAAEASRKERERFESADRTVSEWMAREIAKSTAKQKMEKMKVLAEKTSKREKARRQQEVEMGLLLEKLQELRALRILKLKKQGRFFPDEDDLFMERVRAAVEEEERQAAAAANTSAATTAILNAEEARKAALVAGRVSDGGDPDEMHDVPTATKELLEIDSEQDNSDLSKGASKIDGSKRNIPKSQEDGAGLLKGYEGLPPEFHYYFFGSSHDMGTLIEVRQAWDTFIMPGGSRIPQHWIEAPPPADPVWASYLVKQPKQKKRTRVTGQENRQG